MIPAFLKFTRAGRLFFFVRGTGAIEFRVALKAVCARRSAASSAAHARRRKVTMYASSWTVCANSTVTPHIA